MTRRVVVHTVARDRERKRDGERDRNNRNRQHTSSQTEFIHTVGFMQAINNIKNRYLQV